MSELQEQTFGKEGVERSLGYVPASVDMPKNEPAGNIDGVTTTELQDIAADLSRSRDQRVQERESRPTDATVEVRDTAGTKLPDNETLTVEEASHLVTGARDIQENNTDLDERAQLARLIDEARSGVPTEQPVSQPVVEQQPQPQASSNDELQRALQNPAVLAAVEQYTAEQNARANQACSYFEQVAQANALASYAGFIADVPEL
jgi:hypothetical protein